MELGSVVRAIFDFRPSVSEELPLFTGDVIEVLSVVDDFWLLGNKDGVTGGLHHCAGVCSALLSGQPVWLGASWGPTGWAPPPSWMDADSLPSHAQTRQHFSSLSHVAFPHFRVSPDLIYRAELDVPETGVKLHNVPQAVLPSALDQGLKSLTPKHLSALAPFYSECSPFLPCSSPSPLAPSLRHAACSSPVIPLLPLIDV